MVEISMAVLLVIGILMFGIGFFAGHSYRMILEMDKGEEQ